jgi:hypothetical protein
VLVGQSRPPVVSKKEVEMWLPKSVVEVVSRARIKVFYADRGMTRFWNDNKAPKDLRYFTGWYWYVKSRNGRAESEEHGPFKTKSSAYRDGYYKMQLRV